MTAYRTFIGLSLAALVTACASPGTMTGTSVPYGSTDTQIASRPETSESTRMASMEPRMKAMQEMHKKMMNAKTPAERQSLMANHMKAMQGGMAMMKDMHAMGGASEKPPMARMDRMAGGGEMPSDMSKRHQMMTDHMAMMQMMMDMMMDRLP